MIQDVWIGDFGGDVRNANADVIVSLTDGRSYAFTACTPLNSIARSPL